MSTLFVAGLAAADGFSIPNLTLHTSYNRFASGPKRLDFRSTLEVSAEGGVWEVWFEGIRHLRLPGREGGRTRGTLLPSSLADVFEQ
jgi:hypothetical protein